VGGGSGREDSIATPASSAAVNSTTATIDSTTLEQAYEYCAQIARSHYENFTVASWLMPRRMRPHMHAIYAYARIGDDFADEDPHGIR
jgi:hypothetical protein